MIIDFNIELNDLESQPEWIGVDLRIKELTKERDNLSNRFEKDPQEWINKRLNQVQKDIDLFTGIIAFWSMNHEKMKLFKKLFEENASETNDRQRLLQQIDDLNFLVENNYSLIIMTNEVILEKFRDDKLSGSLLKLKEFANNYYLELKSRLNG